jgi:hypothetical protein
MARTAVVAGTATAVSGRVARRQARRFGEYPDQQRGYQQQGYQQQAYQQPAPPPVPQQAAAPPEPAPDPLEQLERLGQLKAQGVLTEEEFTRQKMKILG